MLTISSVSALASRPLPHFAGNKDRNYAHLRSQNRADQYGAGEYHLSRTAADPHLSEVFDHFLKPNDIILELGCNNGNNLLPLARRYKAYGLDLEKKLVQKASEAAKRQGLKRRVKVAQWDFAEDGSLPPEWPNLRGKCKAIYAVHVLSHFSEPALIDAVAKMKPYLAPGGIFVATIIDPETTGSAARDKDFEKYHELVKQFKCTDTLAGFQSQRPSVVDEAFQGMRLVEEYSRPFKKGELVKWALPESRIRWVVYQLEPNGGKQPAGDSPKKRKFSFSALMSGMRSRLGYWANRSGS